MKLYFFLSLFTGMFITAGISSCNKINSCYDEALYQQSKNSFCTTDCPGVIGCDGKKYCNACEAAKSGIRVK